MSYEPPVNPNYEPPVNPNYEPPTNPDIQSSGPRAGVLPPVHFDLRRLTTTDRVVAGATLIAMISVWLPFYTISADFYTVNLSGTFHTWMWLEVLVALVLLAYFVSLTLWDRLPFTVPAAHKTVLTVGTFAQLALILAALVAIPYSDQGMGLGWAAIVALIGALTAAGVIAVPMYLRARSSKYGPGK